MRTIYWMAVIAASLGTSAVAEPVAGTATLAAPASLAKVVGEGGVWHCEGATCTGMADARPALAVAACSAVADANGRVTAFSAGATAFGEPERKRCNRHVKGQ